MGARHHRSAGRHRLLRKNQLTAFKGKLSVFTAPNAKDLVLRLLLQNPILSLRTLRLIFRIRSGPVTTGPYFAISVTSKERGFSNPQKNADKNVRAPLNFELRITINSIFAPLRKFSGDREYSNAGKRLPQRRQARQVRKEGMNHLGDFFTVIFPTFAALAPLREIFRVSVAELPR